MVDVQITKRKYRRIGCAYINRHYDIARGVYYICNNRRGKKKDDYRYKIELKSYTWIWRDRFLDFFGSIGQDVSER